MNSRAIPKIFYLDDDADDLEYVKESFLKLESQVEVITFQDAARFLTYVKNYPQNEVLPCLIIVDLNMPKYNGWQIVDVLQTLNGFKEIPMVIFTTSSSLPDRSFAEKYNLGFVTKPIDAKQMAVITDKFLHYCSDAVKSYFQK